MNNPEEENQLQAVFSSSDKAIARARQARLDTIEEMCRCLLHHKRSLRTASDQMLTHLLRLADNHHCLTGGRFIVKRQIEMSWEYSVMYEIQLWEVRKVFPRKPDGKRFKSWHLSKSDTDALVRAVDYYEYVMR